MDNTDLLLTVQEVADLLRTNVNYVYELQRSGKLKFLKIGRLKCRRETLENFLKEYEGKDITDLNSIREI